MAGGALTAARWSLIIVSIENASRVTRMHPSVASLLRKSVVSLW